MALEVGVQAHLQKFSFAENLSKIPENRGRNCAQRCLTSKNSTQGLQKNTRRPFCVYLRQIFLGKNCTENFLGKFGEIRAKILRTPKNLPAPTPMMKRHLHLHCPFWKGRGGNAPAMPPFSGIPVHIILQSLYSFFRLQCVTVMNINYLRSRKTE